MQIRLTQLLSNNSVTGSDVMVTDVSGPFGYVTKQATVDKVAEYITGTISELNLNYLSSSNGEFETITASVISASQYIGVTAGSNPAGPDKSVQFNSGSQLSGSSNLTYDYGTSILSGTVAEFTTVTASNLNVSNLSASTATFSGSILIYGTAALAQNPTAAYIIYSSSLDKLVAYPGLYVSGGITGSDGANFVNLRIDSFSSNVLKITGNYDLASDIVRHVILVNAATGEVTASLPLASTVPGREYIFKKTDSSANAVVVYSALDTIDGEATKELLAQYETITVVSDGTGSWFVL